MKKQLFKKVFMLLLVIVSFVLVVGCSSPKATITFEKAEYNAVVGDVFRLPTTVTNSDAEVAYSFSAEGVVSFANGTFTALKAGEVTITAYLVGNEDIKATIKVNVSPAPITGSISLAPSAREGNVGDEITVQVNIDSESFAFADVSFTLSSDAAVLTPNASNSSVKLSLVAAGSVTLTASVENTEISASVTITSVLPDPTITLSQPKESYLVGATDTLTATVVSPVAQTVVFSSSDDAVVTVDNEGHITATGLGTATVTATVEGTSISASATIVVVVPITSISVQYEAEMELLTTQNIKNYV